MEDWSLQALIGAKDYEDDGQTYFGSVDIKKEYDQALIFSFPHLFDTHHPHHHHHDQPTSTMDQAGDVGNELDQLYKPFYPVFEPPQEVKQEQEQEIKKTAFCGSPSNTNTKTPQIQAPKLKKRKNQQKRVVVQVTQEGLSSDLWAWRKYGQKPIKGSPYPRSYYRCSSSKGCLARRQVEQSCTDPGTYLLTYTAEHNHAQPTRRNSLAGINRSKFRATPKSPTISDGCKTVAKDSPIRSPTTPSFSSIDEEVLPHTNVVKQEKMIYNEFNNQEIKMNDDDFFMPEMVFSDDFFEGLGDLSEFNSGSSYNCSNKQFSHVRC